MKKLMTALTICAVAGFAVAADVVSENIVGFNTTTVAAGSQGIVGCNFEAVGGGASTFQTLNGGMTFNNGDTIWVWDGTTPWKLYTWDSGEGSWWDFDADDAGDPAVDAGVGFWLICSATKDVRLAGQVPPSGTQLVMPAGQSLISTPVPMDLDLNGANVSWSGTSNGDTIWAWDGTTPWKLYTWDAGEVAWWDFAADDVATGVSVAGGNGFWLFNAAPVSMTMTY